MSSLPNVKKNVNNGEITGYCDPGFERVAEEFERNFRTGGYMMPGPDGVFGFNTRAAHAAELDLLVLSRMHEDWLECMRLSQTEVT